MTYRHQYGYSRSMRSTLRILQSKHQIAAASKICHGFDSAQFHKYTVDTHIGKGEALTNSHQSTSDKKSHKWNAAHSSTQPMVHNIAPVIIMGSRPKRCAGCPATVAGTVPHSMIRNTVKPRIIGDRWPKVSMYEGITITAPTEPVSNLFPY